MPAIVIESKTLSTPDQARLSRRLPWCMTSLAVILGGLQTVASRHVMNSDAISYLDMGTAFFSGHRDAILNRLWSPMYPMLLGFADYLVKPSAYFEFSVAHAATFVTYLLALAGFTFFLRVLLSNAVSRPRSLPKWSLTLVGYCLFLWSSLTLIDLTTLSPDLLASAFFYTAMGLLVKIRSGQEDWKIYAALGITLGGGFLAKAFLLPIGLVCLAVSVFAASEKKRGLRGAILAGVLMGLVMAPYVVALSRSAGRLTIGEAGAINYAWHVNGVPRYHWRGEHSPNGTALHPSRKILDSPPVYEFAHSGDGTYPLWFNPAYWNEGLRPRLSFADQGKVLFSVGSEYLNLLLGLQAALVIGVLALLFANGSAGEVLRNIGREWMLIVVPVAGIGMFLLVHFESRYIAAFLVVMWLGLLASIRSEESLMGRRLIRVVVLGIAALLLGRVLTYHLGPNLQEIAKVVRGQGATSHIHWRVADALQQMGTAPGDRFAIIKTKPEAYYWARLARAQVVAEMPDPENRFWSSTNESRAAVVKAFRSIGVKGVVTPEAPPTETQDWQSIGDTGYWVYLFRN